VDHHDEVRPHYTLCSCGCRKEYHVGECVTCGADICPVYRPAEDPGKMVGNRPGKDSADVRSG
jgi:hypothetical protein